MMKQTTTRVSSKRIAYAVCYIFLHIFVVPSLLVDGNSALAEPLTTAKLNVLFDVINFAIVFIILFPLLYGDLKKALAHPISWLWHAVAGLGAYIVLTLAFSQLINRFYPDFSNVNDVQTEALIQQEYLLMKLCTVILVPVTEELLYRGAIFGALQKAPVGVAFTVSTLLFCAIHVIGYIGAYPWLLLLICFMQYIPAGLCLCWAYHSSGTIWTNILIHMAINEIAMLLMR